MFVSFSLNLQHFHTFLLLFAYPSLPSSPSSTAFFLSISLHTRPLIKRENQTRLHSSFYLWSRVEERKEGSVLDGEDSDLIFNMKSPSHTVVFSGLVLSYTYLLDQRRQLCVRMVISYFKILNHLHSSFHITIHTVPPFQLSILFSVLSKVGQVVSVDDGYKKRGVSYNHRQLLLTKIRKLNSDLFSLYFRN